MLYLRSVFFHLLIELRFRECDLLEPLWPFLLAFRYLGIRCRCDPCRDCGLLLLSIGTDISAGIRRIFELQHTSLLEVQLRQKPAYAASAPGPVVGEVRAVQSDQELVPCRPHP